jgi:ABC-2 type transport system ATP-binding protein
MYSETTSVKRIRTTSAVRFEEVWYRVGRRAILNGISLDIEQGNIAGILGPNGAGKSTLLSMIIGLRRPSQGNVTILGQRLPVQDVSLRQRIGVVLQETALYDELTTFENLQFSASLYNVSDPKWRVGKVLELLGLSDRAGDVVKTLSGGMRRRIAIARSLLHSPELLVIDEPTLGVDVEARHTIWSYLRLLRSNGTTVIVATNYLDEALALCDTVAVLRKGELLVSETPDELVSRAGYCLDIECKSRAMKRISSELSQVVGVLRIDKTAIGLSVFLAGDIVPDSVTRIVLDTAPIEGFRFRAPDLAEVFHALGAI